MYSTIIYDMMMEFGTRDEGRPALIADKSAEKFMSRMWHKCPCNSRLLIYQRREIRRKAYGRHDAGYDLCGLPQESAFTYALLVWR
jgi:hypothetical protein